MTTYEDMDLYQVASIINSAAHDDLVYLLDKDGTEVPLLIKRVSKGRILLEEND